MNENTTAKRPVRKSAVVSIVIWSVVFCLLGTVLLLGLTGITTSVSFLGLPALNISFGGFTYEDVASYNTGNTTLTDTSITDLSINWLAGDVTVKASDTDEIRITEDYGGDDDDLRLRWKVEKGKLIIQFRKSSIFGSSASLNKNLTVSIPAAMLEAMDEVEIETVSSDVRFTGNADQLTLDTVEGELTVNGDIGEMELHAVDGEIDFNGAVRRAEVECVDATIIMHLDMAADLTFDQVDADITLYLAETVTGFAVEVDAIGGKIDVDGFEDTSAMSNKSARWGDGSLRVDVNGVDVQLLVKKETKD